MKILTRKEIIGDKFLYGEGVPESWKGTVIDFLSLPVKHQELKIIAALNRNIVSRDTMALFAVNCANTIYKLSKNQKIISAVETLNNFWLGQDTYKSISGVIEDLKSDPIDIACYSSVELSIETIVPYRFVFKPDYELRRSVISVLKSCRSSPQS